MRIAQWIHNLPKRLEVCADVIDDLANGAWVASDEHRDRLFGVEAQLWRIAQRVRKDSVQGLNLLSFLDRSLRAARSNIGLCIRLEICTDEDALAFLKDVLHVVENAIADVELILRTTGEERSTEATTGEDGSFVFRAAGGRP